MKIMKKLLLFAFAVVAIASCKRTVDVENPNGGGSTETGDVIQLVSGTGGVAMTMADGDPIANQGVRKFFILGDQIALYAAYVKDNAGTKEPDWAHTGTPAEDSVNQVGPYFQNMPASCTTAGTVTDSPAEVFAAKFGWGLTGTGGVGVDRTYPRNGRSLYVYGYYPYTKDSVTLDPAKGPLLKITLVALDTITEDAGHKQSDVLYTRGYSKPVGSAPAALDTVSRNAQLDSLVFKHALAQVNFVVTRLNGAAESKLRRIEFSVPKAGVLNIMEGKVTVTDPTQESEWIKYVITDQVNEPILLDTESTKLTVLKTNPLMILPLTAAEAKKCKLKLTVYYGSNPNPSLDPTNEKTFIINLNSDAMKAFAQGKKNTLTMQMSETIVEIKASIEPWVDNTDSFIIPVE